MKKQIYDFVAIGLGPFNLSLACLTEPIKKLNGLFVEQKDKFDWHPGLMLPGTHLQTPFLSDLVTLASPTNPYSFLNYIKEQGRIYSFYIRENFFLQRKEYNQYCQWASKKLNNIVFNTKVVSVDYDNYKKHYLITCKNRTDNTSHTIRSKKIIIGTGPSPYIPETCVNVQNNIIHASNYLRHKQSIQQQKKITLVGSGQSAAEVYYDLLQEIDNYHYDLTWITRSARFSPLDYSKLTLEMTSPEYIDYFYSLPAQKKEPLLKQQQYLYKGINFNLINAIYDLMYEKKLNEEVKINLFTNSELKNVSYQEKNNNLKLTFFHKEQEKTYQQHTNSLILATGYQYSIPDFLKNIKDRIQWDKNKIFNVNRNYSIDVNKKEIFIQNGELHTHGFTAADLGMACYRNSYIINELVGEEVYLLEKKIAFQQFNAPEYEQTNE